MAETINYPLMLRFQDTIAGNGFLARITLSGRALMVNEDGTWWMYGVSPGAIAEGGETPQETFAHFRERYSLTLFDIAEESSSYEDFKDEIERFYNQTDQFEEGRWEEFFEAIRSGKVTPQPPFATLQRVAPETRPTQIEVRRLDDEKHFHASDNVLDAFMIPIAA